MDGPQIPEDKKLDVLRSFRDRAWASFDERRRHEYHISLAYWAIYIVITGYVLRENIQPAMKWPLSIGIGFLALAYGHWNYYLAKTQQLDRAIAIYFGERLLAKCDLELKKDFEDHFRPLPDNPERTKSPRFMDSEKMNLTIGDYVRNWNHRSELLVTILLTVVSISVIWWKV